MGRKCSSVFGIDVIYNVSEDSFKVRILAGVHLNALTGCLFDNPMRDSLAGMKNTCTTVISLFFMLCGAQNLINQLFCTFSKGRCPPAVISSVTGIYFLVIKVLRLHMAIIRDVFRKILIGTLMLTDKAVIPVTDKNLCWCCFYNCRLAAIRVQYRVIVAIILKMIVIRYFQNVFIVNMWNTYRPAAISFVAYHT